MKIVKILSIFVLALSMSACNKPIGELVGSSAFGPTKDVEPYGMIFIRKGSFLMGANEQSAIFSQPDNNVMVTVHAFWMDDTEVTNDEYRQFVHWVRDSIAYMLLIDEEGSDSEYALQSKYEDDDETVKINWDKKIPWSKRLVPDDPVREALSSMFYDDGYTQMIPLVIKSFGSRNGRVTVAERISSFSTQNESTRT